MPSNSDSRFRSFAERYVIERARNWPADGTERDRAWSAMLDAKSIYAQIAQVDKHDTTDAPTQQAGQGVSPFPLPTAQRPPASNPGSGGGVAGQSGGQGVFFVRGMDAALLGAGDWLREGQGTMAAAGVAYAKSVCSLPAGLKNAFAQLVQAQKAAPPVKRNVPIPNKRWWNK